MNQRKNRRKSQRFLFQLPLVVRWTDGTSVAERLVDDLREIRFRGGVHLFGVGRSPADWVNPR
jgi:hypothetical protein